MGLFKILTIYMSSLTQYFENKRTIKTITQINGLWVLYSYLLNASFKITISNKNFHVLKTIKLLHFCLIFPIF